MASKKNQKGRKVPGKVFHFDAFLMLLLPSLMAIYYYGVGALARIAACMGAGLVCELFGSLLMRCPRDLNDCSALFIGTAMALMLPADVPFYVALSGVAFAIVVVKLPLGGTNSVPFVPTAAGFAFMSLCWPEKVFAYPVIGSDHVQGVSIAGMLHRGTSIRPNPVNFLNLLTGNVPGPMGASCVLLLLAAMVYMGVRYRRSIVNALSFLLGCALMAFLFPRVTSRSVSVVMELCSGLLLFSAVFLITDPAISPSKRGHRLLYGFFSGVLCMALRHFSNFEECVCFGVLISNAVWPAIEIRLLRREKQKKKARKAAKEGTAHA